MLKIKNIKIKNHTANALWLLSPYSALSSDIPTNDIYKILFEKFIRLFNLNKSRTTELIDYLDIKKNIFYLGLIKVNFHTNTYTYTDQSCTYQSLVCSTCRCTEHM